MKAIIQLVADSSGVRTGIGEALTSLDKMRSGLDMISRNPAMQIASRAMGVMFDSALQTLERVQDAARMYSPEGARGFANLEAAKVNADIAIGKAMGPYQEALDNIRADRERQRAEQIASSPEALSNGAILMDEIKNTAIEWGDWFARTAGNAVSLVSDSSLENVSKTYGTMQWENPLMRSILDLLNVKLGGS